MATYYVDGAVGSDANAGTSPGAGNAWATIAHLCATMLGGDVGWVKASATYNESVALTPPAGSSNLNPTRINGYTTTTGDGGQVTVKAAAAAANFTLSNYFGILRNIIFDFNATGTAAAGFLKTAGTSVLLDNCTCLNVPTNLVGFKFENGSIIRCIAKPAASSSGNTAFLCAGSLILDTCVADGAFGTGFDGNLAGGTSSIVRCLARKIGGKGFVRCSAAMIRNNIAYQCTGDGIDLWQFNGFECLNNIAYGNTGAGIDVSPGVLSDGLIDYNAYGTNTGGNTHNYTAGAHDVTLSGDPFVNGAATINTIADYLAAFALNTTAGAGAACRGAGYPANLDIGAVQSAASGGGGGGLLLNSGMTGGMRG